MQVTPAGPVILEYPLIERGQFSYRVMVGNKPASIRERKGLRIFDDYVKMDDAYRAELLKIQDVQQAQLDETKRQMRATAPVRRLHSLIVDTQRSCR